MSVLTKAKQSELVAEGMRELSSGPPEQTVQVDAAIQPDMKPKPDFLNRVFLFLLVVAVVADAGIGGIFAYIFFNIFSSHAQSNGSGLEGLVFAVTLFNFAIFSIPAYIVTGLVLIGYIKTRPPFRIQWF